MGQLQAVIFDLDGVIADTACLHEAAWRKLCEEDLQVSLPHTFFMDLKGIGRMESLQMILQAVQSEKQFSEQEVQALSARKNQYYQEKISGFTPNNCLPGIILLLEKLKFHHILIGLASASQNAPTVLQRLQLTTYFDAVVPVTAEMPAKPDPTIFLTAARLLQVNPSFCVGIEDAYAGITAILRSGMVAIGIGDAKHLHHAHTCFLNTSEMTFEKVQEVYQANQKGESIQ